MFLACPLSIAAVLIVGTLAKWEAQVERREAVKDAFRYNYAKYEEFSYPRDLLKPISKSGTNNEVLVGFGGTVIDSMSTMLVMGMADSPEYKRALDHVANLTFSHTSEGSAEGVVSIFELTIRYLGGLISAFQLGGEKHEHRFLIDKAAFLANRLSWGWEDKNRIPFNEVNINDGVEDRTVKDPTCIAGAGTLTMEWGTLSELTGNTTYRKLAEGAVDAIIDSEPVFPSLWPMQIWPHSGIAKGDYITWGGGSDSFYEYVLKYPYLLGNADHHYLTIYRQAMESTVKHLLKRTGVGNLTFLADYSTYRANGIVNIHSHLACFSGGNIAMAGRLMKRPDWVEIGLQLAESCVMTYQRSATGVGPVAFGWFDDKGEASGWEYVSPLRRRFYNKNGFFISSESWNHMPEVMESVFYAYRITGQEFWRDIAWDAFLSIKQVCDTGNGWAGIRNVNDLSTGSYDETQSFLFAELLKYLYLIFDDPERFSLDDYVFNTEAHPLKRHRGPKSAKFGKIQGQSHPYERIASTMDKIVPTNPSLDDLPSLFYKANDEERLQQAGDFKLPSRTVASHPGCHTEGYSWYLFCHSYSLLLVPFTVLVFYRLFAILHRRMRQAGQRLYIEPPPAPKN